MNCTDCKQAKPCRLDMQDTAFGPLCAPRCRECYAKDAAERRADGKRFNYRPRIVPFDKLEECK
jgi:hypothetical protein